MTIDTAHAAVVALEQSSRAAASGSSALLILVSAFGGAVGGALVSFLLSWNLLRRETKYDAYVRIHRELERLNDACMQAWGGFHEMDGDSTLLQRARQEVSRIESLGMPVQPSEQASWSFNRELAAGIIKRWPDMTCRLKLSIGALREADIAYHSEFRKNRLLFTQIRKAAWLIHARTFNLAGSLEREVEAVSGWPPSPPQPENLDSFKAAVAGSMKSIFDVTGWIDDMCDIMQNNVTALCRRLPVRRCADADTLILTKAGLRRAADLGVVSDAEVNKLRERRADGRGQELPDDEPGLDS